MLLHLKHLLYLVLDPLQMHNLVVVLSAMVPLPAFPVPEEREECLRRFKSQDNKQVSVYLFLVVFLSILITAIELALSLIPLQDQLAAEEEVNSSRHQAVVAAVAALQNISFLSSISVNCLKLSILLVKMSRV
jgi:hypothetical protein